MMVSLMRQPEPMMLRMPMIEREMEASSTRQPSHTMVSSKFTLRMRLPGRKRGRVKIGAPSLKRSRGGWLEASSRLAAKKVRIVPMSSQ